MQENDYIIQKLGIQQLDTATQESHIVEVRTLVGEKISASLTEQQLNEYEAIINADDDVIQAWLEQNTPEYKNSAAYKELEAGYHDDPERNDPDKLYANLAWVEKNVPNRQQIVDSVLAEYKASHLATS